MQWLGFTSSPSSYLVNHRFIGPNFLRFLGLFGSLGPMPRFEPQFLPYFEVQLPLPGKHMFSFIWKSNVSIWLLVIPFIIAMYKPLALVAISHRVIHICPAPLNIISITLSATFVCFFAFQVPILVNYRFRRSLHPGIWSLFHGANFPIQFCFLIFVSNKSCSLPAISPRY